MAVIMACGCTPSGMKTMSAGIKLDPPVPSCVTHDCTEVAPEQPDLTGRDARCGYGCGAERPSSPDLPFFEYHGPGSREATVICECGHNITAHTREGSMCKCTSFKRRGPRETDSYYCGCRGWD